MKNKNMMVILCMIGIVVVDLLLFLLLQDYSVARILDIVMINLALVGVLLFSSFFPEKRKNLFSFIMSFAIFELVASLLMILLKVHSIIFTLVVHVLIFAFCLLFVRVDMEEKPKKKKSQRKIHAIALGDALKVARPLLLKRHLQRVREAEARLDDDLLFPERPGIVPPFGEYRDHLAANFGLRSSCLYLFAHCLPFSFSGFTKCASHTAPCPAP